MDTFWLILSIVLMLVGVAGCILPLLPGPPICYAGLLVQQLKSEPPFTTKFLLIWAVITVAVTALDFIVPLFGTRKFGGTKYGIWGCTIGLIAGFWMGPLGIILGPFIGAFVGEWIAQNNSDRALKAAIGSFIGFLFGTLLKLVTCLVMVYYFIASL